MSKGAALVLKGPRTLAFEPLEDIALQPHEVRIRTLFSGVSAGTELSQYRGSNPFMQRRWDATSRLFLRAEEPSWTYPVRNLGYEEVGEIVEVGRAVENLAVMSLEPESHYVRTAAGVEVSLARYTSCVLSFGTVTT